MLAIIMAIEDEEDRLFVEMIFNKYSKNMYLVAANILNNHDDAEDCVQDTFVKIIDLSLIHICSWCGHGFAQRCGCRADCCFGVQIRS